MKNQVNFQTLKLYWEQSSQHKSSFFMMLILIPVGAAIIDSALPYVLSLVIGAVSKQDYNQVYNLLWIAGGVGLIGSIFNYAGFMSMMYHESQITAKERLSVFDKLINKDNLFFVNQKIGAMTSRYIDFVRNHITVQDLFIIRTLSFVITLLSGIVILFLQSWIIAVIVLALVVLLVIQIRWSTKIRSPWRHERKNLISVIHGDVADSLTNNLIVRTFAGEQHELKSLSALTTRFSKIYQKDIGFVVTEGSLRVFLMICVQVVIVIISVDLVRNNHIDLAAAVFVLAYMQRIGSQLFILGDIINGYDNALLEAQPMTEMLLTQNVITDSPNARELVVKHPSIDFENLSYKYEDNDVLVIDGLSLHIKAGQKVGLVGYSGAGKSTLVQLLLRFQDPVGGRILIDGQDIRDVTQTSLRQQISYVPQEPMLFHRSLRENIMYGQRNADESKIIEATKKANAWEFISELPEGLDTIVGERGVKLSGGQRQRIAIARALLKDSPILLLDEATSALDSESERMIQKSLESLMLNRTSIVVAHRLSTIAKLDRIIVLDNGKIIEDGTHRELLALSGTYAKLWAHQSGGFIEE